MEGKTKEAPEAPEPKTWYTPAGVAVTTAMDTEGLGWSETAPVSPAAPEPEPAEDILGTEPEKTKK